ncbi:peptidoglycan-binding domain-containing protein [Deinococcus apachensis]|uniref:peptidoglycan-binding domain-containing protein n=1 Tax=Deinococcus apachensis TaxID=309886 RepID=UPI0003661EDC|nr:peptidoglycan-binding domain-containing protein [Deinococcus apachensis]
MKVAAALLATLLTVPALAAPTGKDVERAATRAAQALDGVLRSCPVNFARVGTPGKRCVGVQGTVEEARTRLGAALGDDLYGVWRSRDEQRSVYNWVRTPGGYVYLRLQPDPEGRAQTLVYLDTPPETTAQGSGANRTAAGTMAPSSQATGNQTSSTRPATSAPAARPTTPRPAPSSPQTAAPSQTARTPAPSPSATPALARVPFTRPLRLTDPRMNGEDVRAVQDRLIALTRPSGGGRGDGWYGPVTVATVRAFQVANGLPVTGQVDRVTWNALFSPQARTFPAGSIR